MGREVARPARRAARPDARRRRRSTAHPVDLDVARFVGDAVVLPGQSLSGGVVDCALGAAAGSATPRRAVPVQVMIRPEQIRLVRHGARRRYPATVTAEVVGHTYYGPDTVVRPLLEDERADAARSARTFDPDAPGAGRARRTCGRIVRSRCSLRGSTPRPSAVRRIARSAARRSRRSTLAGCVRRRLGPLDRALQRPAPAAHRRARRRLREADAGSRVQHEDERQRRARRPDPAGGQRLPGGRVHLRELARADGASQRARAARQARPPPSSTRSRPRYRSPAGDWVGMALRVSSLVYDPALLSGARASRARCSTSPARSWKGKIAIAPTDSDFPPVVGAVIATGTGPRPLRPRGSQG